MRRIGLKVIARAKKEEILKLFENSYMKKIWIILIMLFILSPVFAAPLDLSVKVNEDDIRPLKNPIEIKQGFPVWLAASFILLLIVAIFAFVYFKKKRCVVEKSILPPRPPEELALEALKSLLEMRLIEKGMIKEYYIRLSDIIRKYIEARYKIVALDRTTWELYQEMRFKRIERLHADKIRDFLEDCDLVKFAKYIPTQKEIEEIYKKAEEIIEITKPQETIIKQ